MIALVMSGAISNLCNVITFISLLKHRMDRSAEHYLHGAKICRLTQLSPSARLSVSTFMTTRKSCVRRKISAPNSIWLNEWKQGLLAPLLPLMSINNSRLCSTYNHSSAFLSTAFLSTTEYLNPSYCLFKPRATNI